MTFEETYLNDNILDALYDMHFEEMTPIQERCIPEILDGHDVLGVAQTGTGKTAAYLLPILSMLDDGGFPEDAINCVIMSPTRELAQQIDQAMEGFSYYLDDVSSIAVYGGNDGTRFDQEIKGLRGGAPVVIATPGRLLSHLKVGNLGLAGGISMLAYGAYAVIALFQGQWMLAGFCLTVIGWLLSYIWFNVPPARFMMGDTGSFAIGAGLGVVAMMTNSFFLLPIIGAIFVVEAGSSLIQIFWKKVFHKKLFISAPIHHHLEAKGWGEAKIVMRFWVIAGVFAIIGVFLAVQGGVTSDTAYREPGGAPALMDEVGDAEA